MPSEVAQLTPEERARRDASVRHALASSRLSGGHPSTHTIAALQAYAEGSATIDELVEQAIRKTSRR